MTFYDFVISFEEDNTPLGFLAHNIIGDKNFPKHATCYNELYAYFYRNYIDQQLLASANRALSLYNTNANLA
ncbi:sterile alpha motif-like domain-containing protein [Staphylococcus sp. ACRSN]|uniref:YozE family protein n=1 Tax=Staphylococcus sp. ACRSN TaxID=2918214 RepID=UPI001EF1D080|nr:YozE family protein [Staphylococcus sp. ACRSN]MCG7339484.1 sterile alpha motif-like domain-containing protein [Staphylococcus sp. ACRSN]